jgi:uncharacterized protein (DUF2252 family)
MAESTVSSAPQRPVRRRSSSPTLVAPTGPSRRYRAARTVAHLTPEERAARGRAARTEVPRTSHGVFAPSAGRPDPVALLEEQAKTRVPELVPIRHGRMLVSPFTFFRGAALVMAADLASTPTSGMHAQLCGDAHLSNFGVFASPERRMVFDANDFDETLPGPWEWDLKRLVASFAVAGRENGFSPRDRKQIEMAAASAYRTWMARFATMSNLEVWYSHVEVEGLLPQIRKALPADRVKLLEQTLTKARTRDNLQALSKLAQIVDGAPRIVSDPPLVVPINELFPEAQAAEIQKGLLEIVRGYRSTLSSDRRMLLEGYRFVQLARKVVGVGSVGTRAWILLFVGRDNGDPLFLQAKEAEESVLERFAGVSQYRNHGQRVVAGQRLMQATSDIFLGWERVLGVDGRQHDYYVRQLRDWKLAADTATMIPQGMTMYAQLCGATVARAHARSGDRIAIAAYLGSGVTFDRAMASFAEAYADQNERDYETFAAAVKSGRIQAETGI